MKGDLQPYIDKETYAVTLAARNFRILTAITAKFDLEARSLDVVIAFKNVDLNEVIYAHFPEGFKLPGFVLRLAKHCMFSVAPCYYGKKNYPTPLNLWVLKKAMRSHLSFFQNHFLFSSLWMILL